MANPIAIWNPVREGGKFRLKAPPASPVLTAEKACNTSSEGSTPRAVIEHVVVEPEGTTTVRTYPDNPVTRAMFDAGPC